MKPVEFLVHLPQVCLVCPTNRLPSGAQAIRLQPRPRGEPSMKGTQAPCNSPPTSSSMTRIMRGWFISPNEELAGKRAKVCLWTNGEEPGWGNSPCFRAEIRCMPGISFERVLREVRRREFLPKPVFHARLAAWP